MEFNKYFDHTNLKATAKKEDIVKLCEEAKKYDFASVCINPYYIPLAKEVLKGSSVMTCTVIGFPLGQMSLESKVLEAQKAVEAGADEVDMVINVGALKDLDDDYVEEEIRAIKEAVGDKTLKVILENCYLTRNEIIRACLLAKRAKADFVKTSTGFGTGGATVEDVKLMRKIVGPDMGVKAAGGIHTKEEALALIEAGATRLGCSASAKIMQEK